MAQQVAGSAATLREEIAAGRIATPPLLSWNEWQVWRSGEGRRPLESRDGYSTSNGQESALWRAVMLELHGDDWSTRLVMRDVEEARENPQGSEPSVPPAAPAEEPASPQPVRPTGGVTDTSPGSGTGVPGTPTGAAAAGAASAAVESPGSGRGSPGSWTSQSPGTPTSLTGHIMRPFNPARESLEAYGSRIVRQAHALDQLGNPCRKGRFSRFS